MAFGLRWICICVCAFSALHAVAFDNLDFEQAIPLTTGDDFTLCCDQPIEAILPHWNAESFTNSSNSKGPEDFGFWTAYNSAHIGGYPAIFALFDTDMELYDAPLSGQFSLAVDARGLFSAELFQTGIIPEDTRSIRFSGALHTSGLSDDSFPLFFMQRAPAERIDVSLGGMQLDVVELSDEGGYARYGANIPPALAGMEADLRFVVPTSYFLLLDDIELSPIPVPEPATMVGLLIGCSVAVATRAARH